VKVRPYLTVDIKLLEIDWQGKQITDQKKYLDKHIKVNVRCIQWQTNEGKLYMIKEGKFFYGAYKNNKCYLGYCDIIQDRVITQYTQENEPINGIDYMPVESNRRLFFCTNDDIVAGWDFRAQEGGITKLGFRGSNPQDIKISPMKPNEIAVCDDRKSIFVLGVLLRYLTSEGPKRNLSQNRWLTQRQL
jgi:hypothetical protein